MSSQADGADGPAPRPLQALNLNLLLPPEALLRRRSVSRAAELRRAGIEPKIAVKTESFLDVP